MGGECKKNIKSRLASIKKDLVKKTEQFVEYVEDIPNNVSHSVKMGVVKGAMLLIPLSGVAAPGHSPNQSKDGEGVDKIELTSGVKTPENPTLKAITSEDIAQEMVASGKVTIDNFNLEGYEFSKEDLGMLIPSERAERLFAYAKSKAEPYGKKIVGQTYCLRYTREAFEEITGDKLKTGKHASSIYPILKKNDQFVEIKTEYKNNAFLPDGTIVYLAPGRGYFSGHTGIYGGGFDYAHATYNARTTPYNSDRTKCFGQNTAFVFVDTRFTPELIKKMCSIGRVKVELEANLVARIKEKREIESMRAFMAEVAKDKEPIFLEVAKPHLPIITEVSKLATESSGKIKRNIKRSNGRS